MKWILPLFFSLALHAQTQTPAQDPLQTVEPAVETSTPTQAPVETKSSPAEVVEEKVKELPQKVSHSADHRETRSSTVMVGYQLLSSWIPSKWSAGYTYNFNRKWSLEAEYLKGSMGIGAFGFDAASITETRYSIVGRRFVGNSFNFIIGAFKNDFEAQLGNDIVNDMTDKSIDEFEVTGIGLALGIGNRWQWGNGFTLGFDWFRMNVPLFDKRVDNDVLNRIDDNNDLSRVKDYIDKVKNIPTFVLLGINLGYTF